MRASHALVNGSFYSDGGGQTVAIDFLHRYILGNYRRLYCRTLAAGINHFNQAQILVNLLATGSQTPARDRQEEGELIRATLQTLPPQRALRALRTLRDRRVNNRRTRAVIRDYLASRPDPAFDAVKYRRKVRALIAHAHLGLDDERPAFLFRDWHRRSYETPLFEAFRQAHYSQEAIYSLPYTVAEGLAERHGVPRSRFLARISDQMTQHEKLRLQRTAQRAKKLDLTMDLGRVPLTRLAIYLLSLTPKERRANREVLEDAPRSFGAARVSTLAEGARQSRGGARPQLFVIRLIPQASPASGGRLGGQSAAAGCGAGVPRFLDTVLER